MTYSDNWTLISVLKRRLAITTFTDGKHRGAGGKFLGVGKIQRAPSGAQDPTNILSNKITDL